MKMDQNLNKLAVHLDCIRTFEALPNDALIDLKMVSYARITKSIFNLPRHTTGLLGKAPASRQELKPMARWRCPRVSQRQLSPNKHKNIQ